MPTYDYQCRACGSVTEVIHSMIEEGPSACELCGGALRRVLYPTGIIFKGSGFYRTDSRTAKSSESKSGDAKSGDAKSSDPGPSSGTASATPPASGSGSTTKGDGGS